MYTMNLQETAERWKKVLDFADYPEVGNTFKRKVTAQLLENTKNELKVNGQTNQNLYESAPTNATGANIANWDPILISLVRRSMPNLIAYDICGVQPMAGPTGLIFALKSRYVSQTGAEALFNEADSTFSGNNAAQNMSGQNTTPTPGAFNNPLASGFPPLATNYGPGASGQTGTTMTTAQAEALGDGTSGNGFAEMAFSIGKITVTAGSRALKAEYSMEIAQDLQAVHGVSAENELSNILSSEILTEINRHNIRNLYYIALTGAQTTVTPGTFDLDVDANGRWSVERFKGLLYQLERESNAIARTTRRGRGNILVASSDVASALVMAGMLDYTPALSTNLQVDDTGNTFAGVLNGRMKVYIDPYYISSGVDELAMVGYKGVNPYDAGYFYCPYVPLQMVKAVDPNSFQPKIGFKTRYGIVENPFYSQSNGTLTANSNPYYRLIRVTNLL